MKEPLFLTIQDVKYPIEYELTPKEMELVLNVGESLHKLTEDFYLYDFFNNYYLFQIRTELMRANLEVPKDVLTSMVAVTKETASKLTKNLRGFEL